MVIEVVRCFVKQITCKNEGMNIIVTYMSHWQALEQSLILLK